VIRPEDVADLQPGDLVEMSWEDGFQVQRTYTGALRTGGEALYLGDVAVRAPDGMASRPHGQLRLISRAPRPLYVNHPRTEPVPGDVVRFEDADHLDDSYTNVYLPRNEQDRKPWLSLTHDPGERYSNEDALCGHLDGWQTRLLVDGETGTVPA
jgi:hypothetical protein